MYFNVAAWYWADILLRDNHEHRYIKLEDLDEEIWIAPTPDMKITQCHSGIKINPSTYAPAVDMCFTVAVGYWANISL